jgi:hypothetical protein
VVARYVHPLLHGHSSDGSDTISSLLLPSFQQEIHLVSIITNSHFKAEQLTDAYQQADVGG